MSIDKLSKYQLQKLKKFIRNDVEIVFISRSTGLLYLGYKYVMSERDYRWSCEYRLIPDDLAKLPSDLDKKIAGMFKIVA